MTEQNNQTANTQTANTQEKNVIGAGKHFVSKAYIPLMLARGFWTALLIAVLAAINILRDIDEIVQYVRVPNLPLLVVGGLILIMAAMAVVIWISYKRLTWEITDEEIHIYKGILVKKKSHIPFRRIHSVNIEAKILDRIFGVVTVKLDTAAGSSDSSDAKIPALRLSTAEALRSEIFTRKQAAVNGTTAETIKGGGNVLDPLQKENDGIRGVFAGDPNMDMTPEAEYRLTNKELVLLCISNGKAFAIIFAFLFFIYQGISTLEDFNEGMANEAEKVVDNVASLGPIVIAFIFLVAMIISLIISFVTRALTYGNFVARRYSERIEISKGLLQKKSTGVAVERIQTLKIEQGLIQRILGYAEISLETASAISVSSNDQEQNTGVVIHPFIKVSRIEDYMNTMLKEFNDRPSEMEGLTSLAMRRSIIRYGMWTILLILLPLNLTWYLLKKYAMLHVDFPALVSIVDQTIIGASVFIFILMLAIGFGVWKGRAYSKNERYIAMRKGILGREKTYIPRKKIQLAEVTQNPFQKRVNLITLKANTAVMGSSYESIKDVGMNLGNEYIDWIYHKK